ncbi:MAG: hypothetical protein JRH06_12255 [Deltaproteobacteria bacterium]|nr:hypothetical protein [Deltaproteobacteria bacterium]MBW2138315.1 hypothetical protein [Deltaproteobacteria bacterium]
MYLEQANQLLSTGYLSLETGYTRLPNGDMLVGVLTRMPKCKGKMVDWWFGYVGDTEKYKLWHPHDHLIGEWDGYWRPGHYVGASHLVHEYIGKEIVKLKITFREPSDFLDISRFEESRVGAVVCGDVDLLEEDAHLGHLMHFVRDTDFGCEMRSRFWLHGGQEAMARDLMHHCIEEMGNLSDLLPGLYAEEAKPRSPK